jgi:hypothetical protein
MADGVLHRSVYSQPVLSVASLKGSLLFASCPISHLVFQVQNRYVYATTDFRLPSVSVGSENISSAFFLNTVLIQCQGFTSARKKHKRSPERC